MRVIILVLAAALVGCQTTTTDSIITAQPYIGLKERQNRKEIRELVGVDPVRTEWCAAFVNAILEIDGIPNLNEQDRYPPLMARSFLFWGDRVEKDDIQRGDIVVFPRGNEGWKGHVGFYVETQIVDDKEYWVILGGNQNNEVRYDMYRPRRALGVRRYINTNAQ